MAQWRSDRRVFDEDNKTRYEVFLMGSTAHPFGTQTDSFGRLRTASPLTLFDSQQRWNSRTDQYDTALTGGGTLTHLPNESTTAMNVGTAIGDSVVRETRRVFPYQPGKSFLVLQTFVMTSIKANLVSKIGLFGTQNGIYFEMNGTTPSFVLRSYTSGAIVETRVNQANWNGEKLDGSGQTKYTLDPTKAQILFIDLEWLGVGVVRVGFVIDGVFVLCHTFKHANILPSVYMTTACLPLRWEITNIGVTASSSSLKQICSTVSSEGGYEQRAVLQTVARGTTVAGATDLLTAGTEVPLISIRLKSTRLDSVVVPNSSYVYVDSNGTVTWRLWRGAAITGGTWVSRSNDSSVEYNISMTGFTTTNLTPIREGFVASGATGSSLGIDNLDYQLSRDLAGNADTFTLSAIGMTNNQKVLSKMDWYQLV